MATYRTFVRGKEKYSLSEKKQLGELISNHKEKYDKELKELEGKTRYDHKRKKHVPMKPKQGFIAAAVREFYTDLSKVKHDNSNLVETLKFAKRCYEKYLRETRLQADFVTNNQILVVKIIKIRPPLLFRPPRLSDFMNFSDPSPCLLRPPPPPSIRDLRVSSFEKVAALKK